MEEKLAEIEKRYELIESQLGDASVVSDMENYRRLMKDYKDMTPLVEKGLVARIDPENPKSPRREYKLA